ncbi:carbon-nitrogen hydrolase family protein [Pseudomonas sp. 148P]|uniref:Carbon-nitrogen hydrolase family protein n=1 Tax=Pseudomonas ulcerans TaxID=3115852 RepID=A0ABU7I0X5_9PSED|nr:MULTISPECIES: carbon-nitrogen hydrolase family protein [unclassified Pseudomonas]MEE1926380.1 carbon-nitrogen hydrolase family protein [Pseudomonas sp. 147P]MEE1937379.1 carbon-nitrogen hydrolase family protein [Pseudomonas sp. 148P]
MPTSIVAALQIGSRPEGKAATLEAILAYEARITAIGAGLVVMPEALLGGYPKGETFGTYLGYRLPEGREAYQRYYDNAIDVPGAETEALAGLAQRTGAHLVLGVIERDGNTLYCTALFFSPEDGLVAKHRKLMPTGTERLIWGQGDGSTLPVLDTPVGKLGAAICWENHMPLLRTAMYAKGVQVWCAPTVDERDVWQASMRHIAHEGRLFLVSACQVQPSPAALGIEVPHWDAARPLIQGNSVIVGPLGEVLAGPLRGEEGLISAGIDLEELVRARYDFDVVGHYSRPDVFSLVVDERAKRTVEFRR